MKPIPSLSRTLALTVPAVALTLTGAQAASDYLLELDGIKGESSDSKHAGAIEIESFSWGATNAGAIGSGAQGKSITFTLRKRIDKASPLLFLACAKGNHIPQATLTLRKTNSSGGKTDYYQVTLSDILISSYQTSTDDSQSGGGGGAGQPVDRVSFNYQKVVFTYSRLDETGEPMEEPIRVEHDFSSTPQ
jgi:type VI secretion system secreted protein Hcp